MVQKIKASQARSASIALASENMPDWKECYKSPLAEAPVHGRIDHEEPA